jgi:putative oxidoreductase
MIRVLARPLLASWFVYEGVRAALEPQKGAEAAQPVVEPLLRDAGIDVPIESLVRVHGIATAATATLLAFSKSPRTAGVALTGLAAVTLATATPFWRMDEGEERQAALDQFMKNLSLFGGAMLAATAGHSAGHIKRKKARKVKAKTKAKAKKQSKKAAEKSGRGTK